jgi:hypothetical protein
MSRGPGRVERTIAKLFTRNPSRMFDVEQIIAHVFPEVDLTRHGSGWKRTFADGSRVFPNITPIEKKHRVSVLRAADHVAGQLWWRKGKLYLPNTPHTPVIYYNRCDLRSRAMYATLGDEDLLIERRRWYVRMRKNPDTWIDALLEHPDRRLDELKERYAHWIRPGGHVHDLVTLDVAVREGIEPDPEVKAREAKRERAWKAFAAEFRQILEGVTSPALAN